MLISLDKVVRRAVLTSLFVMFFILDAVFRIRDYDDKAVDFQVIVKFSLFLFCFWAGARFVIKEGFFKYVMKHFAMLVFLLYFIFTSGYAPQGFYSLYISITYLAFFLFVSYVLQFLGYSKVLEVVVWAISLFICVSVYLYIFEPDLGRFVFWYDGFLEASWRMSGLAGSANNFARIVGLGLLIVVFNYSMFTKRLGGYFAVIFLIVSVICLSMSGSRTTMVFVLVSVCAYFYLNLKSGSKFIALSAGVLVAIVLYVSIDLLLNLLSRSSAEDLSSFAGRDLIWSVSTGLIEDSFVWGYGVGSSVYLLPDFSDILGFSPSHAHNMYLQIMLSGGVIGLLINLFLCFSILSRLAKQKMWEYFCYFLFVLMVGIFESGAFALSASMFTLMFFVCYCASVQLASGPNGKLLARVGL